MHSTISILLLLMSLLLHSQTQHVTRLSLIKTHWSSCTYRDYFICLASFCMWAGINVYTHVLGSLNLSPFRHNSFNNASKVVSDRAKYTYFNLNTFCWQDTHRNREREWEGEKGRGGIRESLLLPGQLLWKTTSIWVCKSLVKFLWMRTHHIEQQKRPSEFISRFIEKGSYSIWIGGVCACDTERSK